MSLMLNRCIIRGLSISCRFMTGGDDSSVGKDIGNDTKKSGDPEKSARDVVAEMMKADGIEEHFYKLASQMPPRSESTTRCVMGGHDSPVFEGVAKKLGYKSKNGFQQF